MTRKGLSVLRVMTLNLKHGGLSDGDGNPEDRWPDLAALILGQGPDVVCLQEAHGWLDNRGIQHAEAEAGLGMRIHLNPGRASGMATAVGHRPNLDWILREDAHVSEVHGYALVVLDTEAGPLTVISTHLTPYSSAAAATEAQILIARLYRHTRLGILIGDINHPPADGDGGLDWSTVHPYNRSSRTLRMPDGTLKANTIVGDTLARGDLTDVALHLGRGLRPTGHGGLRVDQAHVTPHLLPAVTDLRVVDTGEASDHDAVVVDLDLARITAEGTL